MNGSDDVLPGVTLEIVNATNNTRYACVLLVDGMDPTDSEPVYLYVAGMLYLYNIVLCVGGSKGQNVLYFS